MNVLLTGVGGMIGSHFLNYLLKNTDWYITAIVSPRNKDYAMYVPTKYANRGVIIPHDLTDPLPIAETFDYIIQLASIANVEQSIYDPVAVIKDNVAITLNMLEYARQHPPRKFINFSTTGIYNYHSDSDDWGSILPTSPYIGSKVCQESIAISYYRTYDVPVIITNANNVIGKNQDSRNFLPKIIQAVLKGEEVPIYATNGEFGSRLYSSVENVSDALLFILNNVTPTIGADRPDRYGLGDGEKLNNLELAQAIAGLLGKPLHYRVVEADSVRPGYDPHYTHLDDKLVKLGWEPKQSLEDGLKEIIKDVK